MPLRFLPAAPRSAGRRAAIRWADLGVLGVNHSACSVAFALALALLLSAGCSTNTNTPSQPSEVGIPSDGGLSSLPDAALLGKRSGALCPCPDGQICVYTTCCIECHNRVADAGCPIGETLGGRCSNQCGGSPCGDSYCSKPCTPHPNFCVYAPSGCSGLTREQQASPCIEDQNGQYGGACYRGRNGDDYISCIGCY